MQTQPHSGESTSNFETVAYFILATGLLSMMFSRFISLSFILAGICLLIIIYLYRFVFLLRHDYASNSLLIILNYIVLSAGLILMILLIFTPSGKGIYILTGLALLVTLIISNIYLYSKKHLALNLVECELRILFQIMMMLLFYFFPLP